MARDRDKARGAREKRKRAAASRHLEPVDGGGQEVASTDFALDAVVRPESIAAGRVETPDQGVLAALVLELPSGRITVQFPTEAARTLIASIEAGVINTATEAPAEGEPESLVASPADVAAAAADAQRRGETDDKLRGS